MQRSTSARSMLSLLSPWAAAVTLFQPLSCLCARRVSEAAGAEERKGSELVEKARPVEIASLQKGEGERETRFFRERVSASVKSGQIGT